MATATATKAPASSPMGAPVLTPQQIQAQAVKTAQAALAPQEQTVANQQKQAAAAAVANASALTGLHGAAAKMLESISPTVQGAYDQATKETGQLAGGFSQEIQDQIAKSQAANAAFAESQGQSAPSGGTQPDPQHLANVLYALGGYIPGSSLASQGAAATARAAELPAVDNAQANSDLNANLAQEALTRKGLQDQLTQIESQRPGAQQAALSALESSNLNNRQFNETTTNDAATRASNARSLAETIRSNKAAQHTADLNAATQARAEGLYEAEFGYKQTNDAANLQIKSNAQKIQLAKMTASGQKIDVGASKLLHYVVDYNRDPVLDNDGKVIVVKGATSSSTPYSRAVSGAKSLRGNPMTNSDVTPITPGIYLAAQGASGADVIPSKAGMPATTNNPDKARRTGSNKSFVEAQTDLVNRYSVTRAQARKALIAEGWVPEGIRPKK